MLFPPQAQASEDVMHRRTWLLALTLGTLVSPSAFAAAGAGGLGNELPLWSALPFVLLLLAIAVMPLVAEKWWHHNKNRALVSFGLAIPFAIYFLSAYGSRAWPALEHSILDYISFMALLGSLYVISGGIHLRGSLAGTPLSNVGMLGIGAVLANLIGTTGASMVLIRPFLRANQERKSKVHLVIFFIFVVSNCGGLLTPLADPPLYLGFLKGVPFAWTLRLWKEWLLVNGLLLVIFNFVDQYFVDREEKKGRGHLLEELIEHQPLRLEGSRNLFLLLGVVVVILGRGYGWGAVGGEWMFGVQEVLLFGLAAIGYFWTRPEIRARNQFEWAPIVEVAVIFAGIFVTMTAPLLLLNARGAELGLAHAWQYFWATGLLSSFLDNAPTYLSIAATAAGKFGVSADGPRYLSEFLARGGEAPLILEAISCGAVFMGANTYIGNGPNFMVKAIAEQSGVKMPSFFGYMAWSMVILLPLFLLVTLVIF
jgi:Na+/H+ antiporter NhaD/arsenite permease-like protein